MAGGWVRRRSGELPWWAVPPLEAAGAGAAFSCRQGGLSLGPFATLNLGAAVGDRPEHVARNRRRFAGAAGFAPDSAARVTQVHGAAVRPVGAAGAHGEADALCTDRDGVTLCVGVADCAAVLLADPVRGAVCLCHAGWRGTVADVAGRGVAALARSYGSRASDLVAAVSPCIGPCCYEVDQPVIAALRAAAPWAGRVLLPGRPGHARLDLAGANRLRLRDAGVPLERIHVAGLCTACRPDLFFSHRRDHGCSGRMEAALWLRPAGAS